MDEKSCAQYLRYHFYPCEKQEHLGTSNQLLFTVQKRNSFPQEECGSIKNTPPFFNLTGKTAHQWQGRAQGAFGPASEAIFCSESYPDREGGDLLAVPTGRWPAIRTRPQGIQRRRKRIGLGTKSRVNVPRGTFFIGFNKNKE